MTEPLPDTGWSREVAVLDDALVVPASDGQPWTGVIGADGPCDKAAIWREGKDISPPLETAPQPDDHLPGTHIWGGVFLGHFGHFMVETISRLWAVRGSGAESVIFVPKHPLLRDFQSYQARIIELLDLGIPVRIVRSPTSVERLLVPGQGFGLGRISRGTPEFRDMMGEMAGRIVPDGPRKIYISRTQFNGSGGVLAEAVIERNLASAGYTPFYPEKMSLDQQLSAYKAADVVVGLDSSAFHIFGFVADPGKRAAVILRRTHPAYRHITEQLAHFMNAEPLVIDTLVANWMPARRKQANHQSWGELDYQDLRRQLVAANLLPADCTWQDPSADEFQASLQWAEQRAGEPLARRPETRKAWEL